MKKSFTTRDVVFIGMLSAVCMIATTIKIPYGNGAMVHLGSAAIFTTALVFGRVYGGFAGAFGAAIFDIIMGFSPYTLWSFVIKGIAGFAVGGIAHAGGASGRNLIRNVAAVLVGAILTLLGYLVAWTAVIGSFEAAIGNAPSSLITSSVGMMVALPLSTVLSKALEKAGLIKRIQ